MVKKKVNTLFGILLFIRWNNFRYTKVLCQIYTVSGHHL